MQIWKSLYIFLIDIKIISWKFHIINPKNSRAIDRKDCEKIVYKHSETIEYLKKQPLLFKKKTLRANNSIILTIKNANFSRYYFYMNTNILGDFQICITVPLRKSPQERHLNERKTI